MNRRNFFSKLSSFVVGCYLASGLKLPRKEDFNQIENIEVSFIYAPLPDSMRKSFIPILYKRGPVNPDESIMTPYKTLQEQLTRFDSL